MMDILSIIGFGMNVVSFVKANPLSFGEKVEEPVAITETAPKSKALADIQLPVQQPPMAIKKTERSDPKSTAAYQKKTVVGEGGVIRMAKTGMTDANTSIQKSSVQQSNKPSSPIQSGLDQSGRYFFRKSGS